VIITSRDIPLSENIEARNLGCSIASATVIGSGLSLRPLEQILMHCSSVVLVAAV